MSIRVVVVDDHAAFCEAVGLAIDMQEDLECVATSTTGEGAISAVEAKQPDVVLMDLRLPDIDGIEATRRIKEILPASRVVVLTGDEDRSLMARAALAGASGFLLKTTPMADILSAIRTAGEGGMLIDANALGAVLDGLRGQQATPSVAPVRFTKRENEVLVLLGEGRDPTRIAAMLGISVHTSRGHIKSILAKLGVRSQLEAVVKATREGLIGPRP